MYPVVEKIIRMYIRKFPYEKGKARFLDFTTRFQSNSEKRTVETAFGSLMRLNLSQYIDANIYYRGAYEQNILDLIKTTHGKNQFDFLLDIGANIGQHSLFAEKQLGLKNIIAFEADSATYERLKENVYLNKSESIVKAENIALSDSSGKVGLVIPDKSNIGRTYITDNFGDNEKYRKIRAVTLDDYMSKNVLNGKGFIKLDVEGAEAKVVRGGEKLLKSGKIVAAIVEICEEHLNRFHDTASDIFSIFSDAGYTGKLIGKDGRLTDVTERTMPRFAEVFFNRVEN